MNGVRPRALEVEREARMSRTYDFAMPMLYPLRSAMLKRSIGGLDGVRWASRLKVMTLKARVRAGRLVVDEPTDLPEGTELELLPLDPGDWLDEADRAALHEALRQSDGDVEAGRLVSAEDVLRELRSP
jgi:hypothetical protein